MTTRRAAKLSPIPFEAQQAQSDWLLEQFDKGIAPDGTQQHQGTNYPGSPHYMYATPELRERFYQADARRAERMQARLEEIEAAAAPFPPSLAGAFRGLTEREPRITRREVSRATWETRVSHRNDEFSVAIARPDEGYNLRDESSVALSSEVPYEVVQVRRVESTGPILKFKAIYNGNSYYVAVDQSTPMSMRRIKEAVGREISRMIDAHRERT